ncbi:MAG: flagellar biosynthesis anti-sigma factor FlgM [Gammaproteobacteria bacterium]|jgi:negative regulator of flagellin synthesis FlgM|nr:flagellar biosynthesis anti-sigma factor FlgM [Gammaproteobacteria bacterium]
MAIEITRFTGRPLQDAADAAAPAGTKTAADAPVRGAAGTGSDKVSFTSTAALLKEIEKDIAALPVVDSARVESVQRQIAAGTYQIDPVGAADKLMKMERALAGKD